MRADFPVQRGTNLRSKHEGRVSEKEKAAQGASPHNPSIMTNAGLAKERRLPPWSLTRSTHGIHRF